MIISLHFVVKDFTLFALRVWYEFVLDNFQDIRAYVLMAEAILRDIGERVV